MNIPSWRLVAATLFAMVEAHAASFNVQQPGSPTDVSYAAQLSPEAEPVRRRYFNANTAQRVADQRPAAVTAPNTLLPMDSGVLQGTLDVVDGTMCRVAGWARDPASTNPIEVQIYRDGPSGTGFLVTTTIANILRPDLPFPDQNHGFDFSLPPDPGIADGLAHTIFAYGVGIDGLPGLLNNSGQPMRCGVLSTVVTDFGAVGDGVTDDSDAIQRAIDASFPGGLVFVPAGTYMLGTAHGPEDLYDPALVAQYGVTGESYSLQLRGAITLRGEGRKSILKLMPVRLGILRVRNGGNILIERLVFDGNAAQRYLRNPATGVSYDWPQGNIVSALIGANTPLQGPVVRDCEIRNGLEDGVGAISGPEFTVESCYIHDNGAFAIDGSGRGGGVGISMNGGLHNQALHNVLAGNTHGIVIGFGPHDHTVEDNTFVGNCSGLSVGTGAFSNDDAEPGSGFLITDNLIERTGACPGIPFAVAGKESGTVADNFVINNLGGVGMAFVQQPDSVNITRNWVLMRNFIGNTAPDRPQQQGIYVDSTSQGINLQGNTVFDNGHGISDQVVLQSAASLNPDWQTANTITYTPSGPTPPTPGITSVLHAATGQLGPVAPGQIINIVGVGLGPQVAFAGQITSYGRLQKVVAGVRVLFDGVPAPLLSVSATEISAVVPHYTYWKDTVDLEVEFLGVRSSPVILLVAESNPGIFPDSISNEDGSPNSSTNPAQAGTLVTFTATGLGQTDPAGVDGLVAGSDNLPTPRGAVSVTLGGQAVELIHASAVPVAPAGATQVTIRVPQTVVPGSALPIVLSVGTNHSPQTTSATVFVVATTEHEQTAVEYYYAAWGYYFVTSFPNEIAALDGGAFGGVWQRTGQTFNVWSDASGGAFPTCRFFSTSFAPKSSHFYTPYASECAAVRNNPNWQYEGIAFYLLLPDANGNCPPGTSVLYRLYNNGMGGAPNHRYTTSQTILNQMLAAGWIFEGNGNTKAFACVPQ